MPSDIDDENLESIRAWRAEAALSNFLEPVLLDVLAERRHLVRDGLLIMYGPFRIGGAHTAKSNETFDADLRRRNSSWGVRDLEAIREAGAGLEFEDRFEMPANNQILVFRRKNEPFMNDSVGREKDA